MISVLFDAHQLGRRQTGNETYVRELLPRLGVQPDLRLIAAVNGGVDPDLGPEIRIRRVPHNGFARLGALSLLARSERADLVHAIYFLPPVTRRHTVLTVHDISYELYPQFFRRSALIRNRLLIRASARSASLVITLSETSRKDIIDRYDIAPDRVVAIACGVAPAFSPDPHWAPFSGRRPLQVLAVGELQPRKNLVRLLDAMNLLSRDVPASLRVVGPNGYQAAAIRDRLQEGVNVEILNWLSERDLAEEYRKADVFAYPSIYEGFGLPILEAMASGVPVVASRGGAIPEVAGDAAILVDALDINGMATSLRRIAEDADLAADLRARGLRRASIFTWDQSALAHAAVYRRLLTQ